MNEWTEFFAMVTAAGGALAVVWRLTVVLVRRLRRAYLFVKVRLAMVEDMPELSALVMRELRPNGGGSLKDRMNELADTATRHFDNWEKWKGEAEHRFEKVEHEVEHLKGRI